MQYQPREVYIGGFNPIYECVLNGFLLIASMKLSLVFAAVVFGDDILIWQGIFLSIVTIFRAKRWHDKWQDRELRIKCIEINYIERLSDEAAPKSKKQQAITRITNRPSKVWWSYLLFFTPHMLLASLTWWLLGAWNV